MQASAMKRLEVWLAIVPEFRSARGQRSYSQTLDLRVQLQYSSQGINHAPLFAFSKGYWYIFKGGQVPWKDAMHIMQYGPVTHGFNEVDTCTLKSKV